jgi:hypothetical protein
MDDTTRTRERVVMKACDVREAFPERGFERRVRGELAVEEQHAECLVPRANDAAALTKTVLEYDGWKGRSR